MTTAGASTPPRVIVALDMDSGSAAENFVSRISPDLCRLKVGFELFTAGGPAIVEKLVSRGFDVFLDLKFHDIPNTVAKACVAAAQLGVWMINVHALGGPSMMNAAREATIRGSHRPFLVAVTVLTSHSKSDLEAVGIHGDTESVVLRLAELAHRCGLDGVVCSAVEAGKLRRALGSAFQLVTPGIRPTGSAANDQVRIVTPVEAFKAGSDYLVIGRPITNADDPVATLTAINNDLQISK